MDSSFNAFSKVVTKHVLGSQERFNELKERMEMCEHATSKAGAAALGYLIAMEEKENAPNIYDQVLYEVENDGKDSMARTDAIFTAIYKWLDAILDEEDYDQDDYIRKLLSGRFNQYMP
jgi:regulator of sigma D